MTKKKNSQNLLNYESICSSISLEKFEIFLKYLFKSLMNAENEIISRDTFYKLFPKFPYFAKKKLYEFFTKKNEEGKKILNSNDLIKNLIKIIYGNKNERIEIFSQFFNFNKDNMIYYEDIRLFYYHLYLFSYQESFYFIDNCLEIIFKESKKIKISYFINFIQKINSDLFFLFYFSINNFFFGKNDMIFFNKNIEEFVNIKDEDNSSSTKDEDSSSSKKDEIEIDIIEPTKELFDYINQNYDLNLEYNEEEECDELESLKLFEDDFIKCRESFTTNSSDDNNNSNSRNMNLRKSCNIMIHINKKKNLLIPRLSTELKFSKTDIKFDERKSENSFSPKRRSSIFSFDNNVKKEDFSNIIMILNNEKIKNCDLNFCDNYLFIKYKNENKKDFLIIPLAYSFPTKNKENNEKNIFEAGINSQIFDNEKSFIFQFPTNSKRNTFYNELKILSNYSDIKDKYNLIDQIGKGGFGQIYLALKKIDKLNSIIYDPNENIKQEKYAIKIINKSKIKQKHNLTIYRNEIEISKILQVINHPNIIKIYDILEDIDNVYLIMEYCPLNIIEPINFNIKKKYSYIKQIINGVNFLHNLGIIHRDIKPENILCGNDGNFKIIDFGFSDLFSTFEKKKEALGSYGYFPPEMILNKRYNLNIDFWNIGIICFYFLFKFFPFGKSSEIGDIKQFDVNKFVKEYHFENEKYSFFIEKIKEIIYSCLNFDINQRGKDLKDIINE